MVTWSSDELHRLEAILHSMERELSPLPGKEILVLCCREGQVALWLGKRMAGRGRVVGIDLNEDLLDQGRRQARQEGLERVVYFQQAEMYRLAFPDESFDALVSEFIVYPSPLVTQIGQPEMARVLRRGGKMLLTDVITPTPLSPDVKEALRTIGLDYLCEATVDDFRLWMEDPKTGLQGVEVVDLTPLLRQVWHERRRADPVIEHRSAYTLLLDDPRLSLGNGLFYIYAHGEKRESSGTR